MNNNIFIAVKQFVKKRNTEYQEYVIYPARDYQKLGYLAFMSGNYEFIKFSFPNDINFTIEKFKEDRENKYPSFCLFINESGNESILSNDINLLNGYVGIWNRMNSPLAGGQISNLHKKKNKKKKQLTKKKY